MDEASKYADMIEVPVNTCNITVKPAKKRKAKRKKSDEEVKAQVIDMVNDLAQTSINPSTEDLGVEDIFIEPETPDVTLDNDGSDAVTDNDVLDVVADDVTTLSDESSAVAESDNELLVPKKEVKKKGFWRSLFKLKSKKEEQPSLINELDKIDDCQKNSDTDGDFSAQTALVEHSDAQNDNQVNEKDSALPTVTVKNKPLKKPFKKRVIAEVGVAVVLVGAVIGTTFLVGGNDVVGFFKGVFAPKKEEVKEYTDFSANLPCLSTAISLDNGVMRVNYKGAVYASTDGVVDSVSQVDGKINLEIVHGEDFKTVISGLDYAYLNTGDTVYANIPVGYSGGSSVTVCLYSADGQITDFNIDSGKIVWVKNAN
ncbi:MAG: hypothetical protein J6B16_00795 [Clostridia bacterium]|nr:hypothetical protein [Clostridia bacterium]